MEDVIDNTWHTGDVNQQWSNKPNNPVGPEEFKVDVNVNTCSCDWNKPEKGCQHGWKGWFVDDIALGSLVDEFQHFMGGNMTIWVGNGPLESLNVLFFL